MDLVIKGFQDPERGWRFRRRAEVHLLGVCIRAIFPRYHAYVAYRLGKGRQAFYVDTKFYTSRCIPLVEKYSRYQQLVQSTVLHGLDGVAADESAIERLH
eukprot:5002145-Pyramimonas_sp.AAC.1